MSRYAIAIVCGIIGAACSLDSRYDASDLVDAAFDEDDCVGDSCAVESGGELCDHIRCEENEECRNGQCEKIDPEECVDGLCAEDCEDGEFDPSTQKCIYKVESISLSTGDFHLFRDSQKEINAIVKPSHATDSTLSWSVKNITEGDSASGASVVSLEEKTNSVVVTSTTAGARKVLLTAHATDGSGIYASVIITLKPYCAANVHGDLKLCTANAQGNREDLTCGFYGTATTKVFNHDLYTEYVLPKMMKKDSKAYGTRASVVAAARFLILQFPFDLKYYDDPSSVSNNPTQSHYVWATGMGVSSWKDAGIFGLNLTNNAYNTYDSSKSIKGDVVPWGCMIETNNKPNGLACSGLVTWALRNGRFFVGDWWTHIFRMAESKDQCSDSSGNPTRYYMCEDYVNGKLPHYANPNNKHDFAYAKLKRLNPATYPNGDFIPITKNLTEETLKQVKAGDLLWHGKGSAGESTGHIAIIIGMKRKEDGTLATMYIGEAAAKGNGAIVYSADFLKNCSKWAKTKCKTEADGKTYVKDENGNYVVDSDKPTTGYDSFILKMGNVYRYYSDVNQLSDDGNTYKYTDMWP